MILQYLEKWLAEFNVKTSRFIVVRIYIITEYPET